MSIITPFQSATAARRIVEEGTELVTAHVPIRTACPYCGGPDTYLGGAMDVSCTYCDQGWVTTWQVSTFNARVMWIDPATPHWTRQGIVLTGEIGQVDLQVPMRFLSILERVRLTRDAHLMADGKRLHIESVTLNRIERPTSLDVRCNVIQDEQ